MGFALRSAVLCNLVNPLRWMGLGLLTAVLAGCSTTGRADALPGVQLSPQPGGCQVQMFEDKVPPRLFTRVGSVGAHSRAGYFGTVSKESVYQEIQAQACRLGADGIIEIVTTENRRFEWN